MGALDVETRLCHFAIVTFRVDPAALRPLVHPRFDIETIVDSAGRTCALVSVVPFVDRDFAFVRAPWLRWAFGQTNYRAYVRDNTTGERAVWFFGTSLDFWGVVVPRFGWGLPWHRTRIRFACMYDVAHSRYTRYTMSADGPWAPATLELEDLGTAPTHLDGFANLTEGLTVLTHPLDGYYYRRDSTLGTYRVLHERLRPTEGRVIRASFPLLERLGLTTHDTASVVHSALLQPEVRFRIELPPRRLGVPTP
jgi:hypothetical protein